MALAVPAGGACPPKNQLAQLLDELLSQLIMLQEKPHVNGSIEGIEQKVEVCVSGEFPPGDPSPQGTVGFAAARPQETFAEGLDQVLVTLAGGENGRDDSSATAAKNFDQLSHLLAHIGIYGSGIRKSEVASRAAGECVGNQGALVGPPAIDGGFADSGALSHLFNFEVGKSVLPEKIQSGAQDGLAGLLAAWTARRPLTVCAVLCDQQPLAHAGNIPYNLAQVIRIRYGEYRI